MSASTSLLSKQLLNKSSVADCSLQEIQALAARYPYFAPAQLLLLHKLREEDGSAYEQHYQKAALFYHQPFAFQHLAHPDAYSVEEPLFAADTVELEITEDESAEITEQEAAGQEAVVEEPPATETAGETTAPNGVETDDSEIVEEGESDKAASNLPGLTGLGAILSSPVPEAKLSFEPYHTVDYFASQGIRLMMDDAPKDKFGKQLKSFTEWLKTMKRLPQATLQKEEASPTEKGVEQLAHKSINEADVYTEAMAEVWIKQGNKAKAIEVYNKLVLHNPSKKPYFAALIENLKRF